MAPNLPKRKRTRLWQQLAFDFEVKKSKPDRWTTDIGEFFEEASEKLTKGIRFQTDSTCEYCPDIRVGEKFIECKGSGRGNRIVLYRDRIEKEREWAETHEAEIIYHIWRHRLYTKTCGSREEIIQSLAKRTYQLVIIPQGILLDAIAKIPARVINHHRNNGGGRGWHLPVKFFLDSYLTSETIKALRVQRQKLQITITEITAPKTNDPF